MNISTLRVGQTITDKNRRIRRTPNFVVTAILAQYIVAVGYDCGAFRIYAKDLERYEAATEVRP